MGNKLIHRVFLVLTASLLLTGTVQAVWDEQQLADAAVQAQQKVLQRGGLADLLTRDMQAEVQAMMDFAEDGTLLNAAAVYRKIARQFYGAQSAAYYYAAAQVADAPEAQADTFNAYAALLDEKDAQRFAFARLDAMADDFTVSQHERYQTLLQRYTFALRNITVAHDQDDAEICLAFSHPIQDKPAQDWSQLITLTPPPRNNGAYRGDEICYRGEWRTTYTVTIDPTLRSDNGLILGRSNESVVATGDRDAMLRFAAKGQTIIADADAALTVESANIDTIVLEAWSIPLENLSHGLAAELLNPATFRDYTWEKLTNNARLRYRGEFDSEQHEVNTVTAARLRLADMNITQSGIYVVTMHDKDEPYREEMMAFSVADAGFSAYLSEQGLWAELRDLRDFTPIAGAEVTLYARDHAILAKANSDAQGMVAFPQAAISGEDGATPDHLLYQHGDSLAYLYLDHQGFDLSDKGLDDRRTQPTIRVWHWLDRGVYRPQDSLHALWLLRHGEQAYHAHDMWLTLQRPDGVIVHEQSISPDASGAYRFDYTFPNTARLGNWQLRLALGKGATVIDEAVVRVDAIQPQQIETALEVLDTQPDIILALQADWLYGAPAKGLLSNGWWQAQVRDWPAYQGWQIGRHDEAPDPTRTQLSEAVTDDNGNRIFSIDTTSVPLSTRPLDMAVQVDVHSPDGQAVGAHTEVALTRDTPYVALRTNGKQAQVALIDDDGRQQAQTLDWTLYRIYRDGYWYYSHNDWQYQYSESPSEQAHGRLTTNRDAATSFDLPVDDGLWLLEVVGADPEVAGSLRIEFGVQAEGGDVTSPEALSIRANQERYQDGEDVVLHIRAPFDGIGSIKLAHGNIFATYDVTFRNHEATLTFPWQGDWAQGIWVLASAWQNVNDDAVGRNPRAVGLTWLGTDLTPYALQPSIDAPASITPDSTLTIHIDVPNADEHSWVNVAVVDEGLYRLAPASFSDPLQAFWGKTPWALSLFDIWGSIIRQSDAAIATLRSGAGSDASGVLADLPAIDTPLITYWSTPVAVVNGRASVSMPVPRFHGKLHIMALAYNDARMGISEGNVIVTEDVISELYTPPYLTEGDTANLRLRLHNTTDHAQAVSMAWEATGLNIEPLPTELSLAPDEERWLNLPFTIANTQSGVFITATINDATIERVIDVRAKARPITEQHYLTLAAGESFDLPLGSAYALGGLGLNHQQLVNQLNSYPYYCSEQTTSRLVGALDNVYGTYDAVINTQTRLANLQSSRGGFGLWASSDEDLWLSAYVGDILLHAKANERLSQAQPLERLLTYLRDSVVAKYTDTGLGYAYYVLARAGVNMQGSAIRHAESLRQPAFNSDTLSLVLALYLYGEDERADALWQQLYGEGQRSHYQSPRSELAQRLYRLHELAAYRNVSAELAHTREALHAQLHGASYSTQELAWLSMLDSEAQSSTVEINGIVQTITTHEGRVQTPTRLTNRSDHDLAVTIREQRSGDADALIEQGYRIELHYSDHDGQPLDNHLTLNQDVVVDATIYRDPEDEDTIAEIMFVYPYSAGEQGVRWVADGMQDIPAYQENRDDRHLAAFTMEKGESELHHQFALRAVREGEWYAPGVAVEDMFRSDRKAQYPVRHQYIDANPNPVVAPIILESLP